MWKKLENVQEKYVRCVLKSVRNTPRHIIIRETRVEYMSEKSGGRANNFWRKQMKRGHSKVLKDCVKWRGQKARSGREKEIQEFLKRRG